jgi:hypothetical protein
MPSSDPNKKMEDLLRAYAKNRREEAGAPFELSPDVRARLQEEVRRALGESAAAAPPRWGLSLAGWLRLALGGAVAALVIFIFWSNLPSRDSTVRFAKAETPASNAKDARSVSPAPPAATPVATAPPPAAAPAAPTPAPATPPLLAPAAQATPAAVPVAVPNDKRERTPPGSLGEAGAVAVERAKEPPEPAVSGDLLAVAGTAASAGNADVAARGGRGGRGGAAMGGGGGGGGRGGRRGAARGGAGAGGFGGGVGSPEQAGANPPSQPAPNGGMDGGANPASQLASNPSAAARRLEIALAPSSTAVRNPQSDASGIVPPGRTAGVLRAAPSSFAFAQQMVRSDLPLAQNAPGNPVENSQSLPSEVLASFQIQRTGQQVRIVDADGSEYEGQVVEPALFQRMQTAAQADRLAMKDLSVPPGAANAAQQGVPGGNVVAQNGYVNIQAGAGELPPRTANYADAAQNQFSSSVAEEAKLAGSQQAGLGGGFAFQVSGLNRRLNQNLTITGNCMNMPLPISGSLAGNLSNQFQSRAGSNVAMENSQATPAQPPASQLQNGFANNNLNYISNQNIQNGAVPGQIWRVTGQVQIGPANHFDLDAATVPP